ncbi:flagellar outer dynein arm light chain 7 [Micromonas pusilla CCMP1545]|jgi:dynein light chain roadblock-type|uniref:Dynein light chain roadblock n=2 Tax=Micromonas pusilla TaxID=38833 RepID=C1N8I5_MICPC|nr:flagellar outer dynein arm light chain 7 [Micromonas pusilla CCMP1545]EEH51894.1 flagellar outer dynein arm light chain 7 [Micromonas pusilla CCMP1545]|tara:strand:- start:810 stop:1106 length:297 start_codon:yes stop_codon:yes gene_type:complete|eukprot:XP_003064272.1 flagellar outer dynein arm light chain 7 [Micromonas pusilla CCMP1545]
MTAVNEVEEAVKRINSHKGVLGVLIINNEGIPIKTTLENAETVQHAALITHFARKARAVVTALDPTNELTFLRVRSKSHEIMIAPDKDYTLVVLQNPA